MTKKQVLEALIFNEELEFIFKDRTTILLNWKLAKSLDLWVFKNIIGYKK